MNEPQKVWKVLSKRKGRLMSSQVDDLPNGLVCVYQRRDGRRLVVRDAFCFATYDDAKAWAAGGPVWEAEAWGCIPIQFCFPVWDKTGGGRKRWWSKWPYRWTIHMKRLFARGLRRIAQRQESQSRKLRVAGMYTCTELAPTGTMLAQRLRIVRPAR